MTVRTSLRILLVEDSPDDAEIVLAALRHGGYEAEWTRVDNAENMRTALRDQRWDLVLCDYAMPRFDALSALEVLKAEELDIPFIIVSGTMGEETAVGAMKAGAQDFFSKDRLARLPAAIDRELREARMRAEQRQMQDRMLLSDRLVAVGTLAAGVAHEINNPLAYVIGNIEFAIEQLNNMRETLGVAEALAALRQAREGTERIRVTARDLKVFCRTDEAARTSVDLERVLESAIRMAWNEIRHRAHLVRDFSPLQHVDGNENRLGQVFLNLLINAAQAIGSGRADQHEIRVTTRCHGGRVIVEVSDTGPGMPPEVHKRLFEPFFTTKPIGVGTGLGLSICHGIVSDLGGSIRVDSKVGTGTRVRVELPVGTISDANQTSAPAGSPTRGARILMVDDEPALCQLVERLLKPEHEVVARTAPRAALELLSVDAEFDLILCDLMMPKMTGMDFYAELSRTAPELAKRIVFMTGGAFTSGASKFLESVPNRRLDKPFSTDALRATIARMISS
ncbi:MAG TPA: response regulator [Polyangiales bacterium]|nr:response regulator [Polyangiales bacterium]